MRIQIFDEVGRNYQITSQNLKLIGEWFADTAKLIMSADARYNHPARLDIWPDTEEETKLISAYHAPYQLTQDDVLELAKHFTEVSAHLGHREHGQLSSGCEWPGCNGDHTSS